VKIPRFSWRSPAPRPAFLWRWIYPVVLVGLVVVAALIADSGLDNALKISEGRVTQVETDPCKPGFLAEVDPTSTMLVIETDAHNHAVGITALSLGADKQGGWVLQIPLETRVKDNKLLRQVWLEAASPAPSSTTTTTRAAPQTPSTTIAPLTAEAVAAGKAALTRAVTDLLGFSFPDEVLVLPTKTLALMIVPALPLSMSIQTPLLSATEQPIFPAGAIKLQKEAEVVQLFESIGRNDPPSVRLKRQIDLWSTWVDALDASPTALAAVKSDSADFVEYVNALATGPSQYRSLPVADEILDKGVWIVDPNVAETKVLAAQMVPFPVAEPGTRLRTALFNGTTNCDLSLAAATRFVQNGAQIGVLGNAATLDVTESEVEYYDAALETRVRAFAQALGIDLVRKVEGEAAVDIKVTLGSDFKG
jgi:hypothetical protein